MYEILWILIQYRGKLLAPWLKYIKHVPDTIKKYYYPYAFLRDVAAKEQDAENLYKDVIEMITQLQKEIHIVIYQGGSL